MVGTAMKIMGILNVTPDSFADGGKYDTFEKAVARGLEMISEGVDIIDIGGESTRPGAERVSAAEEQNRVIPVIEKLSQTGIPISIDTMRAETAELAITAGASIVNDVSGGLADDLMHEVVAEMGCPYILMHWRGHSKEMNNKAVYGDVVKEVIAELNTQIDAALRSGIARNNLIIDPGLGFAKDAAHNWEILNRIEEITDLGFPVLIGGSRKRFLGGETPDEREAATIELTKSLLAKKIWGVRVHSVSPHKKLVLANG
jgi:dihydropteroate synthase